MPTTYQAALDEMFGTANTVLTGAATVTLLGYTPEIRWPGAPQAGTPDRSRLWARVSKQVVTDEQASLTAATGKRIYEVNGFLFIQLFCPRDLGASIDNGRTVALSLRTAFQHTSPSGEVWYRGGKVIELPEADTSYPITFQVRFNYKTLSPPV